MIKSLQLLSLSMAAAWRQKVKSFSKVDEKLRVKPLNSSVATAFVLGCGHSGTTLTAARIGRATEAYLIGKETSLFSPATSLYVSRTVMEQMLYMTKTFDKSVFVEKTPKHIHCIERILKVIPDAKFVITVRNPLDNCASLYKRFNKLNYAIKRWNRDNLAVVNAVKKFPEQILIVHYEELTKYPKRELQRIYSFLNLSWDDSVLGAGKTAYDDTDGGQRKNMVIRQQQVAKPIKYRENTWREILSESQAKKVTRQTALITHELAKVAGVPSIANTATSEEVS